MKTLRCAALLGLLFGLTAANGSGRLAHAYPQNLGPQTYLPGEHVVFEFTNPPDSHVSVYRVPLDLVHTLLENGGMGNREFLLSLSKVAEANFSPPTADGVSSADVGVLPVGYYVATLSGGSDWRWLFSVTSFGLLTRAADSAVVWPVDLRTLNTFRQPLVLRVLSQHSSRQLALRDDGIAVDSMSARGDGVIVASAADGSVQVVPERGELMAHRHQRTSVVTDRPIYRAGQTVNFDAIVRSGYIGAYRVPQGSLRVKITSNRDQRVIYDRLLPVSPYGTVAGSVRLSQNAAVSAYTVSVGDDDYAGVFSVVAYKKPEIILHISTNPTWPISGDDVTLQSVSNYLFGRPAAGVHVHYLVELEGVNQLSYYRSAQTPYDWVRSSPYGHPRAKLAEGDALASGDGGLDVVFRAPAVIEPQEIVATVLSRDASGRTVVARLGTFIHPAAFDLAIAPDRWFVSTGSIVRINAQARGQSNAVRPGQALSMTITRVRWNSRDKSYDELESQHRSLVTDSTGNASLEWTPDVAGTYRIAAGGQDERLRMASGVTYVTAFDTAGVGKSPLQDERPKVIPENRVLSPGEHAHVLLMLPVSDRDVEVAVSTDKLESVRVIHIMGNATILDIPPPRDAASFNVIASLPTADGGTNDETTISIDPPPRRLAIRITPDKRRYVPGEEARMKLLVSDARGRPVRSAVALGVVDEGIYALHSDYTRPFDEFYGGAPYDFARSNWDLTTRKPLTGLRTIANVNARAAVYPTTVASSASEVRSNFPDTAFWSPSVVTDARGRATVVFRWPDNLTTWRATGIGVTRRTDVGMATATALVTKDFLVRLATPRFLRVGDRATIVGIAHGMPSNPFVTLRLNAGTPAPTLSYGLQLDPSETAVASWSLGSDQIGTHALTLYGTDGTRNDAVRSDLPIEGATPEEHIVSGGEGSANVRVSIPPGYAAGRVLVTLSPSMLAEMMRTIHLLEVYPYDCTEQTLSAALPALFVERFLRRARANELGDGHAQVLALKAFDRLQELRHSDGSYGWWENDAAHPFMTAYALYGLAEFKREGWPAYLDPTVNSLIEQLKSTNDDTLRFWGGRQPGSEWNTRAFMLFALADAAPDRVDRAMLSQANAHASGLNSYAVAVLGLADRALGDDAAAHDMLRVLNARVVDDGAIAYWPGQTWDYAWEDDPVETTAYALRLEVELDPANARIPRIISFLRSEMRSGWVYNTKDTAATLYALSEAMPPQSGELKPDETVRVTVDGRTVSALVVKTPLLDAADADIVIPASAVREGSIVGIERSGRGALYWSTDVARYVPVTARLAVDKNAPLLERLFPPKPDVSIVRRYITQHPGPWRIGEPVVVELTVTTRRDLQYVSIEDPFPAGVEHAVDQGSAGAYDWSGLEFLDDRASFFSTRMNAGTSLTFRYRMFPTTAGTFTAPAPTVSSMYGPPLTTVGAPETVTVIAAEATR